VRILINFQDKELIEAESDAVNQDRLTFLARPSSGNNRLVWVSMSAVKYIVLPDAAIPQDLPKDGAGLDKLVIRFLDGEVMRAFRDPGFSQEGHSFNVRSIDSASGKWQRVLVSAYAIKAIFFVEQWDSRAPAALETDAATTRPWPRSAVPPAIRAK
jgi:hypothetical protein